MKDFFGIIFPLFLTLSLFFDSLLQKSFSTQNQRNQALQKESSLLFFFDKRKILSLCSCLLAILPFFFSYQGRDFLFWFKTLSFFFSLPSTIFLTLLWIRNFLPFSPFWDLNKERAPFLLFMGILSLGFYPFALGISSIDPYAWGWNQPLFFLSFTIITSLALLKTRLLGVALFVTLLGFYKRILPSSNLWDYLIDPVLGLYALLFLLQKYALFPQARTREANQKREASLDFYQ